MTRNETTMVDLFGDPALTRRSSQLYSDNIVSSSPESLKSHFQRLTISRNALLLSSTRKSPSSDTHPPTKSTSSCAEPPTDVISESRSLVATDCKAHITDSGNTLASPYIGNEEIREISSCSLGASQHSGSSTPTPNTTPSSSEVTESDNGTGSSNGSSINSSLSFAHLPFGKGQHENRISAASHERFAKHPDDPFREPVQIPGCSPTIFVYPHSSTVISAKFHERYREVVNIFRHNIKEHPQLRENIQYIDYTLKLCGTSSRESHPSILVFCRQGEFKALNGLLASKELKYQYCLRRPPRKYPWNVNQALIIEDHKPFFNLYFWRQRRPRTLFWGQESIRIHSQPNTRPQQSETLSHMVPGLTMCGSVIELLGSESSFSTVGCVIKIDSDFYAITSMHAFRPFESMKKLYSEGKSDYQSGDSSIASTSADKDAKPPICDKKYLYGSDVDPCDVILEDYDYFIDDVEYESLTEADEEELDPIDSRSTTAESLSGDQTQTSGQTREVKDMIALFPMSHELEQSGELDLDWALVKLVDQRYWRPNAFVYSSISSSPMFLSKVAESQPTRETPVFIITGEGTPQRGMLQPGISMLGGINGRIPSIVWTLVPCEQNSLTKGHSGSIVVDAATNAIYGHVIGSNSIGEVYISPYAAIFKQIQNRFPGSAVVIPEPLSTLSSLKDFYMSVREEGGLEFLGRLEEEYKRTEEYRNAAAGLEVEMISPRFVQLNPSDAAAGVSSDRKSPSMSHSTANPRRSNSINDPEFATVEDTAWPGAASAPNTSARNAKDRNRDAESESIATKSGKMTIEGENRATDGEIESAPVPSTLQETSAKAPYPALLASCANQFALASTAPAQSAVLIRRLPLYITKNLIRLLVVWSEDLVDVELLPVEQSEDAGFRSAILKFKTLGGALQAKHILDDRSRMSDEMNMIVEILSDSRPVSSRRYATDSAGASSTTSSATSSAPSSRQASRFNGLFQLLEKISPPLNGLYSGKELPNPESSTHYQNLFSPQPPIGKRLTERTRISDKTLIKNDADDDDDETGEFLKDPVAYAENGAATAQRRATALQTPLSRLANMSPNTTNTLGPSSLPPFSHRSRMALSGAIRHNVSSHPFGRINFPPVNPADQNPPCNTLYVGNLPIDTSEEELKAMFSKQEGYKRLCFRTKQNGPMCFVEFEDVSFATKALHELYGRPLRNSVKGAIRLSFSKNPLGVRSGPAPALPPPLMPTITSMMSRNTNAYPTSNTPPGLRTSAGFEANRHGGEGTTIASMATTAAMSGLDPYTTQWHPAGRIQ